MLSRSGSLALKWLNTAGLLLRYGIFLKLTLKGFPDG